jgi:hypothetical protein
MAIDPNNDVYLLLQSQGSLIAMTLRSEEGTLHGYSLMVCYYSLHLRKELCGNVDTFYVQPEYRLFMPRLMSTVEEEFRSRGVSIIGWPVTMTGKLFKILKKRGYIADDVVMELKLKDLPEGESCV